MKIHHYKPKPVSQAVLDSTEFKTLDLGDGCKLISLEREEDTKCLRAEAVIINGVFVCILTVDRAVESEMKWRLVFHELSRKDLKKIGNKFKRIAPCIVIPYAQSMEDILLEDWPRIFNNRILDCLYDKITVSTTNGTPICEHLFSM